MNEEKVASVLSLPENDPTQYHKYTTAEGSAAVDINNEVIDTENVHIECTKGLSDKKYAKFLGGSEKKPEADVPGMAGFELTFDQDGKYLVWVRYIATDSNSASVWMDYGAAEYRTYERGYMNISFTEYSKDETDYLWKKIGTVKAKAGKTLKIRLRTHKDGCIIDKIIFTKAIAWKPEGEAVLPDAQEVRQLGKMPKDRYPIPPVTPPPEHPRVLFRASDIPQIKKNMESPEMAELVRVFHDLKNREYTGHLEDKDPNYDAEGLEVIAAKAADYVLFGNGQNGCNAISAIKNYAQELNVQSTGDNCRQKGHTIKLLGQVYDWCYPLLSAEDKHTLMYLAQMISVDMEVGFPPDSQSIMGGHGSEHQIYRDWLIMAIAVYDEYPDAYNMVGGKVFSPDSVDYRNWWNQSGTHSQGSSYPLQIRYKAELYAHILIKRMCGAELFHEADLSKIAYEWIYRRRPDGMLMVDGDDLEPNLTKKGTYPTRARDVMFLASVINRSPILKREFFVEGGFTPVYHRTSLQPIDMLVLNDPSIDASISLETLPYTRYYGSPVGEMVARTGWDSGTSANAVVATMTISEYNPTNHGHYDCGHFMIYYRGILANDSGWYERFGSAHHKSYMVQTVAHNSLLVGTPYNKWGNQNQGIDGPVKTNIDGSEGKNFCWMDDTWKEYCENKQNHWAEVIGHEFGPDALHPEYSYIAGDLANAYISDYDDGVNEVLRHMIFLPTGKEKNPAAFVVFDKIDTKICGEKKAFLLHCEEAPEVFGNVTVIKRVESGYSGKLVNQTLLPRKAKFEMIGGAEFDASGKVIANTDRRFWNKGKNWPFIQDDPTVRITADTAKRKVNPDNSLEAGWGRVEISPENSGKIDYFLNVMYVGDAGDHSPVEKVELIEAGDFVGTKIFDRVVMFHKKKNRAKGTIVFRVSGREMTLKINVAGLEAGLWCIRSDGEVIGMQTASENGGIIYFTAPAGTYELSCEGVYPG